ncbi:globin family protein [Acidiluteibacter ferrifornacis]|uniref:Group 1 truncated hemoglobin n=1 Tax=Acidiluteibacter ferrifornacis TaxID=2692424 RepID=A0A6N9NPN6_9FLAO|nr:group 1 truncated hemoglobin [Acidiluteibacter ferrifornacis]NBG67271.1 group 1 truncated hemoglobin [Acidiluteibacter ferrifornacis]
MKNPFKVMLVLLAVSISFASCKDDDDDTVVTPTPTPTEKSIYEKLGGTEMVEDPNNAGVMIEKGKLTLRSVVDSTIFVIAGDTLLQPYFTTLLGEVGQGDLSGFTALSMSLTNFFSAATGSKTITYNGRNMTDAHDPAKYSRMAQKADDAAMDAFIADVVTGAGQNGVPPTDPIIGEIGALLETLRPQVVQR